MTPSEPVLVVGGGIGGLTLAVALTRLGIPVRVFEQAPALHEVGAGVGLWSNAVRALRALGVGDALVARGTPITHAELVTDDGRVVSRVSLEALAARAGAPCLVVDRRELVRAIAAPLPPALFTFGAHVTRVDEHAEGASVFIEDVGEVRGSLVVGADGLRSIVRERTVGASAHRYAGETCFRGIARMPLDDRTTLREHQGRGVRCAVCPLDDGRVYWWATHPHKEGRKVDVAARKPMLTRAFGGFVAPICDAIARTPDDEILQHDLVDRAPVSTWSSTHMTLLGDAAHPTTPNLGQGAALAIEDAVVLARALHAQPTARDAFRVYERARVSRAARVVRQSALMGRVGQWSSPLARRARALALRATPDFVVEKTLAWHILYDAHAVDVS